MLSTGGRSPQANGCFWITSDQPLASLDYLNEIAFCCQKVTFITLDCVLTDSTVVVYIKPVVKKNCPMACYIVHSIQLLKCVKLIYIILEFVSDTVFFLSDLLLLFACSALTLLVGHREGHPACKN